jgi:hypothetical protein
MTAKQLQKQLMTAAYGGAIVAGACALVALVIALTLAARRKV